MNVLDIANKNSFGMPRAKLSNTIFHSQKINEKLMLNSCKSIFSHFFISLNNIALWARNHKRSPKFEFSTELYITPYFDVFEVAESECDVKIVNFAMAEPKWRLFLSKISKSSGIMHFTHSSEYFSHIIWVW